LAERRRFTFIVREGTSKVPNTNYVRGRSREYRAMYSLKKDGWMVSRSAASHGAVDVFAAKDGKVLLVQVKSGRARATKEELEELVEWGRSANGDAEVWYYKGGRKVVRRRVYAGRRGSP
jgi:Holliday junction resolvase